MLGRRRRRSEGPPNPWPLPDDALVLTTSWVVEEGYPVLDLHLDRDGDFQFLDAVHVPEVENGRLVHWQHLVEDDPALLEVVDRLRAGQYASRERAGAPWRIVDKREQG